MTIIKAQVSMSRGSGLSEDRVVNTWHFSTPGAVPLPPELARINEMLVRFYITNFSSALGAPLTFFSPFVTGPLVVRLYNEDVPVPRPLLAEFLTPFALLQPGASLPAEVALVMSYSSDRTAGVKPSSERGRIYLGPFRVSASIDGAFDSRPHADLLASIARHATRLITDGETIGAVWVTYSPTRRSRLQEPYFGVVERGFVDNAWDTQRRRGRDSSTRTLFADDTP
jgi:hypothetical protein